MGFNNIGRGVIPAAGLLGIAATGLEPKILLLLSLICLLIFNLSSSVPYQTLSSSVPYRSLSSSVPYRSLLLLPCYLRAIFFRALSVAIFFFRALSVAILVSL
jgi:hypothetical protein